MVISLAGTKTSTSQVVLVCIWTSLAECELEAAERGERAHVLKEHVFLEVVDSLLSNDADVLAEVVRGKTKLDCKSIGKGSRDGERGRWKTGCED